ncbi:MAG: ImmA/IrrE family metallo-endopeptidase [Actinomycetia bacterium]|nr:ImmA/IrrE family metallo-endopeptidase [Actinomycetes bacterium]
MPTPRVPINGETFRWAREALHMDPETLGKSANLSATKISSIESEAYQPTFQQATRLAKKLDRTLGFLMTDRPTISTDVPETVDFRGRTTGTVSEKLARELKHAEERRRTLLDLENRPARPALAGIDRLNAPARAAELRTILGLSDSDTPPARGTLEFWRRLVEKHGYLVFQTTGVDLAEFKGVSVEHEQLPIIILNGSDAERSKAFTIFHEVAHVTNRTSGMCVLDHGNSEEAVANRFAACFLMPEAEVRALVESSSDAQAQAEAIAERFRVSTWAAAVRLRTLTMISENELETIRQQSEKAWSEARSRQRESSGHPPAWRVRYRDLGASYVGSIARAVEDQRVDMLDATYLLGARIPMVEKMFEEFHLKDGAA